MRKLEHLDGGMPAAAADPAQLPDRFRRLNLDYEDLRFETARLKASLRKAEAQNLALAERNAALQHRLDRLNQIAPKWLVRLARPLLRRVLH